MSSSSKKLSRDCVTETASILFGKTDHVLTQDQLAELFYSCAVLISETELDALPNNLTKEEAVELVLDYNSSAEKADLLQVFQTLDSEQSGSVKLEDVKYLATKLAPEEQIEVLAVLGSDQEGRIRYAEPVDHIWSALTHCD